MQRKPIALLLTLPLLLAAAGCGRDTPELPAATAAPATVTAAAATTTRQAQTMRALQRSTQTAAAERTTAAPTTRPVTTAAVRHSPLWIEDLPVEDVITYFDEVALSSEYVNGEETNSLMRWEGEIRYALHGDYSQEDANWLDSIFSRLNEIEGFPGAVRVEENGVRDSNMDFYFCDRAEFHDRMYDSVPDDNADGATTYSYNGANHIFSATICYWNGMRPEIRKSVMTEEIINSIGFSNDSTLRRSSVVYQYASDADEPDAIDWLLLRLIYAPQMRAGMRRAEAERVIRTLYY